MPFLRSKIPLLLLLVLSGACRKHDHSQDGVDTPQAKGFEKTPVGTAISGGSLKEASGIADSKANAGFLWVEQDSGNPPALTLVGHDGKIGKTIKIEGATNRDWEDIALAPGPEAGTDYLYVGDIGDNNAAYTSYAFYRMKEPRNAVDSVTGFDKLSFTYPDESHDAEAFLVDPATKDIFIITKRDEHSKIYRLPYPQSATENNFAEFVGDLPYNTVVSAALSPDNKEIIVKTYTTLNYYKRNQGETIPEVLRTSALQLDYVTEAQGEALSFAVDNGGFYTLPEEVPGFVPQLAFYKRQ
jgi:hypothetical protein